MGASRIIRLSAIAGLLTAAPAWAQFGGQVNILGQDPELPEVAITADLDGDGLRDIVFASDGDGTLGWYRNIDGAGTFGALRPIRQGPRQDAIAAADLDGDGDIDLVVAENVGNRVVWVENDNGDGSAWTARSIGFGFDGLVDPQDVAVADMDLDGDMDIIAVHDNRNDRDGRVGLYTNNGFADPSFSQQRIAIVARLPSDVELADLSGNGRPDILLAADVGDRVTWIPNNPGGYGAPIDISSTQDRPRSVAVADLDGDADLDVIAASIGDNVVAWYASTANTGTPGFGGLNFIANGPAAPVSIAAGDLDRDGDPDIVVAGSSGNVITWHENQLGTPTPGFNTNRAVSGPITRPQFVFIDNLDGGNGNDVLSVAGNLSSSNRENRITLHRNNGSGSFTNQLVSVFSQQPQRAFAFDANGNGRVDVLTAGDGGTLHLSSRQADGDHVSRLLRSDLANLRSADAGDIDGDGDRDLLVTQFQTTSWLVNEAVQTGSPRFLTTNTVFMDTTSNQFQSVLGDFDGDGDLDAAIRRSSDLVWVDNLNGAGSFGGPQSIDSGLSNIGAMLAGDIDGDGVDDLALTNFSSGSVFWYRSRQAEPTTDFAPAAPIGTMASPGALALADIDGDGDRDLVAGGRSQSVNVPNVVWFANQLAASGDWSAANTIHAVTSPRLRADSVAVLDIDNDGDPDVVAGFQQGNVVASFENTDGTGTFGGAVTVDSFARGVVQVAGADLDGDTDTDLLTVEQGEDIVAMFENRSPLPQLDFGDAPPPYPTLLADNGPRHGIGPLFLGTNIDSESNGQPDPNATGDDVDSGSNDEDGVTFTGLDAGETGTLRVVVSQANAGFVTAWVDFNQDGDWDDAGEQIASGQAVTQTSQDFAFAVPADALAGDTVARVRLGSSGSPLATTGLAADGEVEDHLVTVRRTPVVSVNDVRLDEGDTGTTEFTFTLTLSKAGAQDIRVDFRTVDGSATATSGDYLSATGFTTIAAGNLAGQVGVTVRGDRLVEPDETFSLQLTAADGATLGRADGIGTIVNDDTRPDITLSANPARVSEAGGSTELTATLSAPTGETVTAELVFPAGGTADATDFAAPDRVFTIPAGQTSDSLTVSAVDDDIFEGDETLRAALGQVSNAQAAAGVLDITIEDDDPAPAPDASVQPASLQFDARNVGTTSDPQLVFINNTGNAPLTVENFRSVTGPDADSFVAFGNCTTVPQGASCNFGVEFRPSRVGTLNATVQVQTNDPDTPVIAVAVSGTGTAPPPPPPADDDGVDAAEEAEAPNNGDGNGDGVPDAEQDNVASFRGRGNTFATLAVPAGTRLRNVSTTEPRQSDRPALIYPVGFLSFEIEGLAVGACVDTEIILDPETSERFSASRARYFKFGPQPGSPAAEYYPFDFDGTTGVRSVSLRNAQIVYAVTLCDGLRGDDDITANGRILDPGAPAFEPVPEPAADVTVNDRSGSLGGLWLLLGLLAALRRRTPA